MSKIKSIAKSSSAPMPVDLAKKLGHNGIIELLAVMWLGYDDLKRDAIIVSSMRENNITEEWYMRLCNRWYAENRAANVCIHLEPVSQHEDDTMSSTKGSPPTIDFCFRGWDRGDGYFGAECKNLYDHDDRHIKRYVNTGVKYYINGRYGSHSTVSAMVGYVLSGNVIDIANELQAEIAGTSPHLNLTRDIYSKDNQYKSSHIRNLDNAYLTIHHLFFDFVA